MALLRRSRHWWSRRTREDSRQEAFQRREKQVKNKDIKNTQVWHCRVLNSSLGPETPCGTLALDFVPPAVQGLTSRGGLEHTRRLRAGETREPAVLQGGEAARWAGLPKPEATHQGPQAQGRPCELPTAVCPGAGLAAPARLLLQQSRKQTARGQRRRWQQRDRRDRTAGLACAWPAAARCPRTRHTLPLCGFATTGKTGASLCHCRL